LGFAKKNNRRNPGIGNKNSSCSIVCYEKVKKNKKARQKTNFVRRVFKK